MSDLIVGKGIPLASNGREDASGPDAGALLACAAAAGRSTIYLPGLDGLRALAVIAVLLYHAEIPGIPGGYLGVEVFFVLSGYLITSLLLAEADRAQGRIDLTSFWMRRARRLLPAMFCMVGVVVGYAVLFLPEELAELRGQLVAALVYASNWYFILSEQSYFEAMGRPPLLQHLWSLAVEEQFYLVWPPLVALGVRWLNRPGLLTVCLLGALASALYAWLLYVPDADPSRLYYGTDTRAGGLLVGAALACGYAPTQRISGRRTIALDILAGLALIALGLQFATTPETDPYLYRGKLLLCGLTTAAIIAVAVRPSARLGRLLDAWPLRVVGVRSYGAVSMALAYLHGHAAGAGYTPRWGGTPAATPRPYLRDRRIIVPFHRDPHSRGGARSGSGDPACVPARAASALGGSGCQRLVGEPGSADGVARRGSRGCQTAPITRGPHCLHHSRDIAALRGAWHGRFATWKRSAASGRKHAPAKSDTRRCRGPPVFV